MFNFFNKIMSNQNNLKSLIQDGAFLVDVRNPGEFEQGSAKGAVNIPVDTLSQHLDQFQNKNNIIVFCRSGNRSAMAKQILEQNGFKNVTNGGTWEDVGSQID